MEQFLNDIFGRFTRYSEYKVLNLTNLQINTILYINFSDVNYMNNNDGHYFSIISDLNQN